MTLTGRIGVCSWSLCPAGPADLAAKASLSGVRAVQLALDPLRTGAWDPGATQNVLGHAGISVISGMMAMEGEDYTTLETIRATGGVSSDAHWTANLEAARENARLARRLGLTLVTFHAGFVPHGRGDPRRQLMVDRVSQVAELFAQQGVRGGLETGQESAETMEEFLDDLGEGLAGVNLDPANMILYGMGDPVMALERLGPRVVQVHVKDAMPTQVPGTWGLEVPVGQGGVDWEAFLRVLEEQAPRVDLLIEREAGEDRVGDVRAARGLLFERTGRTP